MAVAASVKGKRFVAKGQRLLGQSLKVASPFLARGTSVFIAYDLVEQIKAYKKGNPDAAIGMLGDGIYLGVDGVEIGIEIAEGSALLEGVSSVTGPIGATIGAVVFIGTDIYSAVKLVDKIDEQIHLTGIEKLIEGLRAVVGMRPEQYIEKLLQEKQVNNELFAQGLAFLKNHTTVRRIIFPTATVVSECTARFVPTRCPLIGQGAFGRCVTNSRIKSFDPGQLVGQCTSKLKPDLNNIMILEGKKNDIKWSRLKPDERKEIFFVLPQVMR
ncbi:hypothetical protein [Rickettsiella endosymbiont of Dermanyssus gallinae]|uniref:hypothetical protein n=1 Tax=Rickettsiella endosymbiont of Dermanyssus gallinae TaxID=2856608 RepID=UPI001C52758C|nr:hypothetical protein [Rickettsiella endosymbiont of Dermanyssus gallinae]